MNVHDVRLETFGIVAAAGIFALASFPARRGRRVRDDTPAAMQAVILRVEEDGGTRTVRAPLPITIGRSQAASLIISDAQVSRLHARIDVTDGTLVIRDLDSRNGTLVNARPIGAPIALREGDEIDIGGSRLTLLGTAPWR